MNWATAERTRQIKHSKNSIIKELSELRAKGWKCVYRFEEKDRLVKVVYRTATHELITFSSRAKSLPALVRFRDTIYLYLGPFVE